MFGTDLREAARRHHRMVGLYAVIFCHVRQVDVLYFPEHDLAYWSDSPGSSEQRAFWLLEDLRSFFPHQQLVTYEDSGTLASAFLGIRDISSSFPPGEASDAERIRRLRQAGMRVDRLQLPRRARGWTGLQHLLTGLAVGSADDIVHQLRALHVLPLQLDDEQ